MRRSLKVFVAMATAALIWAPAQARADGYVSPWVAANSGAGFESGNVFDNGRAGFGVTAGAMGGGIFGAEVDFGYSPSFFGTSSDFGSNSVIDVMGNYHRRHPGRRNERQGRAPVRHRGSWSHPHSGRRRHPISSEFVEQ